MQAHRDPVGWALDVLELKERGSRRVVQRRFRDLVRRAHPDHGGAAVGAAARIAELTEARRVLLQGR